ncbi:MAG: PAS domain S-box protein [Pseudomonadota bacterium]
MSIGQRSTLFRYGFAVLAVLLTAAARLALEPLLVERAPFLPFVLAILVTVFWSGVAPAIVSVALSLLFGLYFSALGDLQRGAWLEAAIFLLTSAGLILVARAVNRARGAAHDSDKRATVIAEELNLLIDGAEGHAIYMLDPTGHVTIWNSGAERLKGWTEAEVLGHHMSLFYPPEAIEAGKPEADLARATKEGRFEQEDWRLRKDGSEFLAAVSITALRDHDGRLRGFAKIISDITERRAAEDQLRSRESHLRSILSTVPDAMVVIDAAGVMLSFSAAAQALFGYTEDMVVGRNVSMLMPSPDRERHDGYIRRYLETGEKRIIGKGRVVFAERADGTTFPMELSIGEATGGVQRIFTGFIRDLTRRRQTEARLESIQSELIHVSRLSAMGTMASTLAHELNQPITAIANYAEAVRDQLVDLDPADLPMMREALADTASEALRAGQIVRRLREFVAHGDVEKTIEALPALINEASVLGLMGSREKGIEPRFDLDPYASPVLVDRVQIQQVVINLIRNACEAMSHSPERRLVVSSAIDRPGFVRVTVSDTGPGVAPDMVDQLFTAFVSTKEEGMGLGLSICQTIVEANGGRIWMEPGEAGGSNFHFTLVRAQTEDVQ